MSKITLAAAMLAATGLTACGTDDSTSQAFCSVFADASTFTLSCDDGCIIPGDDSAAHDGDLDTAVAITPVGGKTSATITLTVENGTTGVDLAAGSVPGVFVTRPASHGTAITTYHNGGTNPVDSSVVADQQVIQSVESGSAAETFLGLRTDDPFDEVRFVTSYDWGSDPEAPTYFLYEICSSGGNT